MRGLTKYFIATAILINLVGLVLFFVTRPKIVYKCPKGQVMVNDQCFTPGVYYYDRAGFSNPK